MRCKGIEDFMNFYLTLLFFLVTIKGVLLYTKWDPQDSKKCPAAIISCHKISHNTPDGGSWE